jgi:putative ABC transport system permease protein
MFGSIGENVRVAISGLGANKLRSALTMLGITIGVSAVIVLVSLGQAVENAVRGQFLGLGTNLIILFGAEDSRGSIVRITLNEAEALADPARVPDALYAMPQLNLTRPISFNGREASGRIRGVTDLFPTIRISTSA